MANLLWLSEVDDEELGDDVKKNIKVIMKRRSKNLGKANISRYVSILFNTDSIIIIL